MRDLYPTITKLFEKARVLQRALGAVVVSMWWPRSGGGAVRSAV